MLRNPVYTGTLYAGRHSRGKFCSLVDEGLIIVENAHEAIVSQEIFDEVAQILSHRRRHYAPTGHYLLSRMVTCIHCGRTMTGVIRPMKNLRGDKVRYYFCDDNKLNEKTDRNCPHPSVRTEKLEKFILEAIREHLLDKKVEKRIQDAIVRAKSKSASHTSQDEKRLVDIRRKIERGTENLALATKQDFTAISNLLTKWREEEAEIMDRIERRKVTLEPLPEALEIIRQFGFVQKKLQMADRLKLQYALRLTIASIRVGVRKVTTGDITCREHFGELQFHEALLPGKVLPIPDEAIGQRKIWRELGALVRQADRPLHLKDFCDHIGTKDASHAAFHVRRAEKAGLIRKIGWYGGWMAVE